VPQFGSKVVKQMDMMAPMIKNMAVQPGMSPAQAAMQRISMDFFFNGIREVLTTAQAGVMTLRLNDAGATVGFSGHFTVDSQIGKALATSKTLAADPLAGLPAGQPLLAGAGTWDGTAFSDFISGFYGQMLADPALVEGKKAEDLKAYAELNKQAMMLLRGGRLAIYEPKPGQKGLIHAVALLDVTDSAKYMTVQQAMLKDNLVQAGAVSNDFKMEVTSATDPVAVKGLSFQKITVKFSADPDKPETPQSTMQLKMAKALYGDQLAMYSAPLDATHVLMVMGDDTSLLEQAAVAATTKSPELSKTPEIATASKEIVPDAAYVAYLPVDRWIAIGKQIAKNGGEMPTTAPAVEPGGVVIKENIAPLTISAATGKGIATVELHLPISALANISQNIHDAQGPGAAEGAPMMVAPQP
jgi:hypothetical protein